jgi:hypothetical protein
MDSFADSFVKHNGALINHSIKQDDKNNLINGFINRIMMEHLKFH